MNFLFFPFLAFLGGVVVGDLWLSAGVWVIVLTTLSLFLFLRKRPLLLLVVVLSLLVGYFGAYYALSRFATQREEVGAMVGWDGHDRTITGTAKELLSVSEFSHKYRVTVSGIDSQPVDSFDISVSMAPNLSLTVGDSVTILGRFSFPRDTVDYMAEKQLWNRGIIADFRSFHIDKVPPEEYSYFVRMRSWFDLKLSDIFPPQGHDILSGIILGQKTNLDAELKEHLKASGLMHIMVVSGSNVMMLIIFLSLFLRGFAPWIRIILTTSVIFTFVLLVGGDVPVWRAALMGIIGYSVSLWGYRFSPLVLPVCVAVMIAIFNPLSIVYDIGLQLSFLSVICIIAFGKQLTGFFAFLGSFFDEAMSLTVAATIGTFPITLFYFGTFSLVGPFANLLAAPAIPILMYGGIATIIAGVFSDSLAYIFGYIPWFAVTYLERVISLFGSQKWSLLSIDLSSYRGEFMSISLAFLCIGIVRAYMSQKVEKL